MDILTHTVTGMAVGTVVAAFSRGKFKRKTAIILAGTLGGALPDIDAISLWSKFDAVIGSTLSMPLSGRNIYFGKHWYSHHALMHSIFMAALLPLLWWLLGGLISRNRQKLVPRLSSRWLKGKLGMLAFFLGYTLHLFEDTPTPSGSWGGINLLWPSTEYIGGYGKIWWWNNYDLFLIVAFTTVLNIIILLINRRARQVTLGLFSVATLLFFIQVNSRGFDFNQKLNLSFKSKEARSKAKQKEILGETVYGWMEDFDNSMNLNF